MGREAERYFCPCWLGVGGKETNIEPPRLPWVHFKPLQLQNFDFESDPDTSFTSDTDADPLTVPAVQVSVTLTLVRTRGNDGALVYSI